MVAQICSAPRSALQRQQGQGASRSGLARQSGGGGRRRRQLPRSSWRHPTPVAYLCCRRPLARAACGQGRVGGLGERVRQQAAAWEAPSLEYLPRAHRVGARPPARRLSTVSPAGLRLHGCGLHVAGWDSLTLGSEVL